MSSSHPWDPNLVSFTNECFTFEGEMTAIRGISAIETRYRTRHIHAMAVSNHRLMNNISSGVRTLCSVTAMASSSIPKRTNIEKSSLDVGQV